jgi:DNA polymerase III psi subunit
MNEARRRAYLDALGLDVWLLKAAPAAPVRLAVNPGRSSTLLICASPEESVSRFAADIARALGDEPAWGWPDHETSAESLDLLQAINQHLFTHVMVFGDSAAAQLCEGPLPPVLGSAKLVSAPDLDELAVRGAAKQALWKELACWCHDRQA